LPYKSFFSQAGISCSSTTLWIRYESSCLHEGGTLAHRPIVHQTEFQPPRVLLGAALDNATDPKARNANNDNKMSRVANEIPQVTIQTPDSTAK